mgnify:FL=1
MIPLLFLAYFLLATVLAVGFGVALGLYLVARNNIISSSLQEGFFSSKPLPTWSGGDTATRPLCYHPYRENWGAPATNDVLCGPTRAANSNTPAGAPALPLKRDDTAKPPAPKRAAFCPQWPQCACPGGATRPECPTDAGTP